MSIQASPARPARSPRFAPLLLALASLAALAAAGTLVPDLPAGSDQIAALETWPALAAAVLGLGVQRAVSPVVGGSLAAAMTLSLVLAASAALLQTAFATGAVAAVAGVSSLVFLAAALAALDVALVRFAPARVRRS